MSIKEAEIMTQEELEAVETENQRLKEENEQLRLAEEERLKSLPTKERLYEKVHVSLRTMNIIVGILFAILAAVLILGLLDR